MDQNGQTEYLSSLKGIYTHPHNDIGANEWENSNCTPNGPFLGNGDMQAVLLGDRGDQIFYINKSDMWTDEDRDRNVRPVPTGGNSISHCPAAPCSASFRQELRLWDAQIHAVSEGGFTTDSFIAAEQNLMLIRVRNDLDRHLRLPGGAFGPLLDFLETGRLYAKTKMPVVHPDFLQPRRGILYPVGLGPWGVDSTVHDNGGEPWLGCMVSNASYTGMLFIWQYEYYQDRDWLREVGYPYIRELADFWTSHIRLIGERDENGNYVLYGASWEESFGKNPIVDLGLVRTVLRHAVQYSLELSIDEEERPVWNEILEHLPPYPKAVQDGKEVFVEKEGAVKFRGGCDLQMVYPAEAVSGIYNPELLPVIYNTIDEDLKSMTKPFHSSVIAVRMGYPIERIVNALREKVLDRPISTWLGVRENLTLGSMHYNSEFIEFLDSCLLQSQDGVIRVFPGWYPDRPAEFYNLRAKGAFLVSAAQDENGRITELSVRSERGGICTVEAPSCAAVMQDGKGVAAEYEDLPCGIHVCRFQTKPGGVYEIHGRD